MMKFDSHISRLAVSVLVLASVVGLEAAGPRASLRISGVVPVKHGLQLSPSAEAQNLQFLESPSWVEIANVSEVSNSPSGYKITVETENRERLVGGETGSSMSYRLRYGASGDEQDVVFEDHVGTAAKRSQPAESGVAHNRLLLEVPSRDHPADVYSDVIVLTITAN